MPVKLRHLSAAAFVAFAFAATVPAVAVEFKSALDDSPIDMDPIKGEEFTDAVKKFHETGENPYNGNADEIAAGQKLYNANCQVCHKPDGSGGMGPALNDDAVVNPRANTDVGMFEIIHSGAAGAMRPFAKRGMTQDQMLKIIAFINTLKK
ncbi:c-type cytochrome [Hyphomicrobium sp. D-2]|uniref:c-type cytochrome n=1 Tax=Hyphomicrobium sp. D-2 TaxID=3041621 RepID=UPI0024560897|nr:c-type cytochrome [Hyphomicrobium sp. D-2]MDH4981949.1 c-type cytochrome [Hyphomicrobium sp. D-2]